MTRTLADGPRLRLLDRVSPSIGEALRTCALQVAFRADADWAQFRRLRPSAALGIASHALLEAAGRGDYDGVSQPEIEPALTKDWNEQISRLQADMEQAWPLGTLPPPARWPGYQLTRVRLLRVLSDLIRRRRDGLREGSGVIGTEEWLEASDLPLCGRVDRVERSAGGVELVDLKSGWTLPNELQPRHQRQLLFYAYLWHDRTGEWPQRASVQRLDGTRLSFEIDPAEAEGLVSDVLERFEGFNRTVEDGSSPAMLASPSTTSCRYCDYRAACPSFFGSTSEDWGWFLRSVMGRVTGSSVSGESAVLEIAIEGGNVPEGIEQVRLIGLPTKLLPKIGQRIAEVDAAPTRVPSDLRAGWETQLYVWE